mmetsp:Transcript_52991/g.158609  ORF Transcript_52991/g.158609 Transcript_52991/m.158609 type:complete len:450 (-) Transcript_52991:47-1396(-)|eukprot:CAMPEP_0113527350 /NCGR_PEP_ID=MMETSP0015_2-20120614/1249_1 /TAXON_ID=2838 /ORGANISM="Odontella" /LENGTH=449 /DNA_ID=CAMNT_0000425779 /DNA_START=95 /DNA_END=1444 /DNA_ORIENTATION=+ /assembly_acc=CAM_ASM_000160
MADRLERLREIFGDWEDKDLIVILSRHKNDVEAAVDAICMGETVDAGIHTTSAGTATIVSVPPQPPSTPSNAQQPPCSDPPADVLESTTRTSLPRRNGSVRQSSQQQDTSIGDYEREAVDLAAAIQASKAPEHQGRLAGLFDSQIAPDELAAMLHDSDFVSGLDEGMRAALFLQMHFDAEERSLALASGGAVSPGTMAPPISTDAVSWNGVSTDSNGQEKYSTRQSAPLLTSKWKSALAPATANLEESVRAAGVRLAQSLANAPFARKSGDDAAKMSHRPCDHGDGQADADSEAEAERERVKKESTAACLQATRDHLLEFLSEKPDATYAEWIEALHPENVPEGQLLEGLARTVDHRFFVEESDHRQMWNEHLTTGGGQRIFVPARSDYAEDLLSGEDDNDFLPWPTCSDNAADVPTVNRNLTRGEMEAKNNEDGDAPAGDTGDLISFY